MNCNGRRINNKLLQLKQTKRTFLKSEKKKLKIHNGLLLFLWFLIRLVCFLSCIIIPINFCPNIIYCLCLHLHPWKTNPQYLSANLVELWTLISILTEILLISNMNLKDKSTSKFVITTVRFIRHFWPPIKPTKNPGIIIKLSKCRVESC